MRTGPSFVSSANCPNEKMSEAAVLCLWILQPQRGSLIIHKVPGFDSSLRRDEHFAEIDPDKARWNL